MKTVCLLAAVAVIFLTSCATTTPEYAQKVVNGEFKVIEKNFTTLTLTGDNGNVEFKLQAEAPLSRGQLIV